MTCDMDVARSLGHKDVPSSEQRGFVTFAQSKVKELNKQTILPLLFHIYFDRSYRTYFEN